MVKSATEISSENVLSFRFKRNYLAKRAPKSKFIEVLRQLGGLQSQVQASAYAAVWARVEKVTVADIEKAQLKDKTIVKNWSIRGTLHLMPSDFYRLFISIVGESWRSSFEKIAAHHELDVETTKQVIVFLLESLKGGPKTRKEVSEEITKVHGEKMGELIKHSWGVFFHYCANMGHVCFGPNKGTQTTFVLCDQWFRQSKEQTLDDPIKVLTRLYLKAYGPASLFDFGYWSGLKTSKLKQTWDELDTLDVQVQGKTLKILREDYDELVTSKLTGTIRLLPNFDVYLLAHRNKELYLDKLQYKKVYKIAGWVAQTMVEDGKVIGLWGKEQKGKNLTIEIEPFGKLAKTAREKIEKEAISFGDFLGKTAQISFKKP